MSIYKSKVLAIVCFLAVVTLSNGVASSSAAWGWLTFTSKKYFSHKDKRNEDEQCIYGKHEQID